MSCTRHLEAISAYLDGELAPEERAQLEQHVAGCTACAKRLEGFRGLKHAVARLEGRASPPEGVYARIEALRFRLPPPRRWRPVGLAVAVFSAALMALVLNRAWWPVDSVPPLYHELIADHLRYVPEAMPAEVASQNSLEVRRFFVGQVPFEPVVPVLERTHLLGGRVCKIDGRKSQLLFYQRGDRKFSLYVSDRPLATRTCYSAKGQQVCGKRRGRLSLMLVGDAPREELLGLLGSVAL